MVKCVFCGREEPSFRGTHLIRNIGVVDYFCSGKCRKNATKLKRDKRKWKWTEGFHITREKSRAKAAAKAEPESAKEETKKKSKK